MKTLFIVRHAKSSWADSGISDKERPLNARGKHDLPKMAERFKNRELKPQHIISSTAVRARETSWGIAEALGFAQEDVVLRDDLYLASAEKWLSTTQGLDDQYDSVMITAHNPGITDFSNWMCDISINNIPTLGVSIIQWEIDEWKQAKAGQAKQLEFDYPKKENKGV